MHPYIFVYMVTKCNTHNLSAFVQQLCIIDNSHREEFLPSSGGTSLFLQLTVVSSRGFSSTSTGRADILYNPCVYFYTSIMSLSFDDMEVRGEQVSLVGWHNLNSSRIRVFLVFSKQPCPQFMQDLLISEFSFCVSI